jgi:hypothetical protein
MERSQRFGTNANTRRCRHNFAYSAFLLLILSATAFAQVNSWTNSFSGHWEEAFWSLGTLPAQDQSVQITNAEWKAVGVFPSTPINYPASMSVHDLTLSAIPGSFNLLLLNYSGTERPLEVLNTCRLGQNGAILNLYSGLRINGTLTIAGGELNTEGGELEVKGATTLFPGNVNLTNSQAAFGDVIVMPRNYVFGGNSFTVAGGSLTCSNLCGFLGFTQIANANSRITGTVSNVGQMSILGGRFSATDVAQHGTLIWSDAVLENAPHLDLAGRLETRNASLEWGALNLSGDSIVGFASLPSTVQFHNSANLLWNSNATLRISYWAGSLNGGGLSAVSFGNSSNGLSIAQLQRVEFYKPAGLLPGAYLSRILDTGEVIPTGKVSVFGWTLCDGGWPGCDDDSFFSYSPSTYLTAPAGLTNVIGIAAWRSASLALKGDGTLMEWKPRFWTPLNLNTLSNIVAVCGGDLWVLALRADGVAFAMSFASGDVGIFGSNIVAATGGGFGPAAVKEDGSLVFPSAGTNGPTDWSNLVAVAGGETHLLGLKTDGTVVAWGDIYFQVGQTNVPPGLSNVIAIAAGGYESVALKNDGTVVAWGSYPAPALSNVVAIAATSQYSVALHANGTIRSWGYAPPDPGLSSVVAIAGGSTHCLALLEPRPIFPPLLAGTKSVSNSFEVNLATRLAQRYVLEWSTDLRQWNFLRNVAGKNGSAVISEPLLFDLPQRFYRVRVLH